ncbi:MAG: LuxR C-terminal-related transcriptional regulator [Paracoccaceae bacterium]
MDELPSDFESFALEQFSALDSETITPELIDSILQAFADELTMRWYLFASSDMETLNNPEHTVFSNASEWMELYGKEDLRQNDPIVKYTVQGGAATTWEDLMQDPDYGSDAHKRVMDLAAMSGLSYGVSIPTRNRGTLSVLTFANNVEHSARHYGIVKLYGSLLATKLNEACTRMQSVSGNSIGKDLSEREIECLKWAGEGKTAWEISMILEISERTVVFHLTNATKKLGASTRQHAISKALLRGILVPKF